MRRPAAGSSLNPNAAVFVPESVGKSIEAKACESDNGGTASAACGAQPTGPDAFAQLPDEIIAVILEAAVSTAGDVARLACVCTAFRRVLQHAPLTVRVPPASGQPTSLPHTRRILSSLCKFTPGLVELGVAGLPLQDADLVSLLQSFPSLRVLDLHGCQKLSPGSASLLLPGSMPTAVGCSRNVSGGMAGGHMETPSSTGIATAGEGSTTLDEAAAEDGNTLSQGGAQRSRQDQQQQCPVKPGAKLQVANLQRCYQLEAAALSDVLAVAQASSLSAALLSHLTLERWHPGSSTGGACTDAGAGTAEESPQDGAAAGETAAGGPPVHSQAAAAACVRLQQAARPRPPPRPAFGGLRVLGLHNCVMLTPGGLKGIAMNCQGLQLLMLGGSTIGAAPAGCSGQLECSGELRDAAVAAVHAWTDEHPDSELALVSRVEAFAVELIVLAATLPRLHAIEITFCPPGIAEAMRHVLGQRHLLEQAAHQRQQQHRGAAPQVWDLREAATLGVAGALAAGAARLPPGPRGWAPGGRAERAAVRMALQAATACSSAGRRTPLHIAAEQGALSNARALLQLGALVGARDRGGGTPLFRACFHGHAPVAAALLAAGAQVLHASVSFETPLYIAALRGHVATVDLLLEHYRARGLHWQDPSLYEAGWTPLMAAAVADRVDVAERLLRAAGSTAVPMVTATNRYGQTALHLAARRGCMPMLRLLLDACGPRCAATLLQRRDCSGDTPLQAARKHRHADIEAEVLRHLQATRVAAARG